jgi:hypothetical protein
MLISIDIATKITMAIFQLPHAITKVVMSIVDLSLKIAQYYLLVVKTILLMPITIPMKIFNVFFGVLDTVRYNVGNSIDVMSHRALSESTQSVYHYRQVQRPRLHSSTSEYHYREARPTRFHSYSSF